MRLREHEGMAATGAGLEALRELIDRSVRVRTGIGRAST
jgi:hypothetical protein